MKTNNKPNLVEHFTPELNQSKRDTITITWHIDDIKAKAVDDGIVLTDSQARDILSNIKRSHDASIGINWDVISAHIETYKEND